MIIASLLICVIGYEAIMWGWTMNRHATWLQNHPEDDDRVLLVGPRRLKFISTTSAVFSICTIFWWVYLMVEHPTVSPAGHTIVWGLIIFLIQLSVLNLFTVIARYSCLPRSMWPLISTWLSVFVVRYMGVEEPPLTSVDVHACRHRRKLRVCKDAVGGGKKGLVSAA